MCLLESTKDGFATLIRDLGKRNREKIRFLKKVLEYILVFLPIRDKFGIDDGAILDLSYISTIIPSTQSDSLWPRIIPFAKGLIEISRAIPMGTLFPRTDMQEIMALNWFVVPAPPLRWLWYLY